MRRAILAGAVAVVLLGAYAGGFAWFRATHAMRHNTGEHGPEVISTTFQIRGALSRLACFALVPAMRVDRALTGRDTVVLDRDAWDSYFLSEHLPALTADPAAMPHC